MFLSKPVHLQKIVHTVWYKCVDLLTTTVGWSAPWDEAVLPLHFEVGARVPFSHVDCMLHFGSFLHVMRFARRERSEVKNTCVCDFIYYTVPNTSDDLGCCWTSRADELAGRAYRNVSDTFRGAVQRTRLCASRKLQ